MPMKSGILPEFDSARKVVNCRDIAAYKSTYKSVYIQIHVQLEYRRFRGSECSRKMPTLRRFFGVAESRMVKCRFQPTAAAQTVRNCNTEHCMYSTWTVLDLHVLSIVLYTYSSRVHVQLYCTCTGSSTMWSMMISANSCIPYTVCTTRSTVHGLLVLEHTCTVHCTVSTVRVHVP